MRIAPFRLERFFARYEFGVPFVLGGSDCESQSIDELLAREPGARERLLALRLGYTESPGSPELRGEIAGLYESIRPEETLVHAGAEEAIFTFMSAVLAPGGHAVVHWPCYQSLEAVARAAGCTVTRWRTGPGDGWELDLGALRRELRRETQAIVVNSPHNPTGYQMERATLDGLVEIARERGLLLFSDEVYRGLEHGARPRLPAACDLYEHAVSLGVMSKTFGLPGLRIGWLASHDRAALEAAAAFKDYTSICSSAPAELLAAVALRQRDAIVPRNLAIVRRNLDALAAFFAGHAELFEWRRPDAGATAFPRLAGRRGATEFCRDLAERAGVLLVPGAVFDFDDRHVRIGYGRANLPAAVARLTAYLDLGEAAPPT